ncbi:MAG: phosphoribosylglycinamide formyltransferase [Clostridiales bacterium]|jgi:phosphoribosylglycinamide formyltransferase-1|nr:phosphoribosylglycinamide formyltransferase [Clostridiales bacterium]
MLRTGVLVSGGGTNLQALLDATGRGDLGAEIAVVVSDKPEAFALERARAALVKAVCVERKGKSPEEFERLLVQELEEERVELVVLAGFLPMLGKGFISHFRNRAINIHPSLIPSFCGKGHYGLKVHEAALARGVKITGATVHFVDEGADTGPILLQKAVDVKEGDTPETLQRRVMEEAEWILLPEAVRLAASGRIKIGGDL